RARVLGVVGAGILSIRHVERSLQARSQLPDLRVDALSGGDDGSKSGEGERGKKVKRGNQVERRAGTAFARDTSNARTAVAAVDFSGSTGVCCSQCRCAGDGALFLGSHPSPE